MSETPPPFSPPLVGRAENALRALLHRLLAPTGGTYYQWVALSLTAAADGAVARETLTARLTHALKVDEATATATVAELVRAGLLAEPAGGSEVVLTELGTTRYRETREVTGRISARLYGDLPEADLAAAGRVLHTVIVRADAELAGDGPEPATAVG